MKTHSKSIINFFVFASIAMMLWMSIKPISAQTQNLPLQEIKQNRERDTITITDESTETHSGEQKSGRLPVESSSEKLIYVLDGEIVDYEMITLLSPQRIKMVNVLKGEAALEKYKDEMKNKEGVIEIETHQIKFEKLFPD